MRAFPTIPLVSLMLAACATETSPLEEPRVALSDKELVDVYEAVLRYRMQKMPLSRGSECDVFVAAGALPVLAKRFPEYHMSIRAGSVGSPGHPAPPVRWYDLSLGRTAAGHVFVIETDARDSLILELPKQDSHWTVVS